MERDGVTQRIHILYFMLQGVHLCLDLKVVKKVIPLTLIEKVPYGSTYLVGIMNLAGNSVPIIDLALRLGLNRKNPYSLDTPIILCQQDLYQTGIVVDKIVGIEEIEESTLQGSERFLGNPSPIIGSIELNDNLILMLNISTIIDINTPIKNDIIMNASSQSRGDD